MKVLLGKRKNKRVWELDVLRGVAVLAMVVDHLLFDFSELDGYFAAQDLRASSVMYALWRAGIAFQNSAFRFWAHYIFVSIFLILVGISCTFSKSNGKRAFIVAYVATGIFLATKLLQSMDMLFQPIIWGILQNISFNIVLYTVVEGICRNRYFMLGVGAAIVLAGICIKWYALDSGDMAVVQYSLPPWQRFWTFIGQEFPKVVLGTKWYGADCFSVLPCAGMTLIGGYIGKTFYPARQSLIPKLDGKWTVPFTWVGRHALIWYVVHQPAVLVIVYIIAACCGIPLF